MKIRLLFGIGVLMMAGLAGCAPGKAQTETQMQTKAQTETQMQTKAQTGTQMQTETQMEASKNQAYHKISPEEAKEMMDGQDVIIVDVRTPQEYKDGHVPDAVNIPNEDIGDKEPALLEDKDATILVYCRSGKRSKEASDKLIELGYTQVFDFGGIIDWPYDTVKEE